MSILDINSQLGKMVAEATQNPNKPKGKNGKTAIDDFWEKQTKSDYVLDDKAKTVRQMIIHHFTLGDVTMQKPRVEFNDLSVINRMQVDQMAFNTYQPNNGDATVADPLNAWKSRAIKPVVRNKVISIAAHATARLIFPKVFANDDQSNDQQEAAIVMEDLMEWTGERCNYEMTSLDSTLTALTDPASITYTEYAEIKRTVKRGKKEDGTYETEDIIDPILSGFQDYQVPCDQLYIENIYEPNIQKQGWLIWRRVASYSLMQVKYQNNLLYRDFQFVRPGVQLIYNDANQSFYEIYDSNMRQEDCEEVIYWNRNMDLKIIMVNGVMLTEAANPNPRNDKLYPFSKFGYEKINNRFFYYKSLAFKMQQDANIVNTLYPMIIDGTYLRIMPPMVAAGTEMIAQNVIVPGAVTTLTDASATLNPINTTTDQGLMTAVKTLEAVEQSLDSDSADSPVNNGQSTPGDQTAYEISRIEQNAATVLGLFIKMRADFVKQYGTLRMGDILQYLTIVDTDRITDNPEMVYKTFLLPNKQSNGKTKTRKIKFDSNLSSEPQTPEQKLQNSYDVLKEQGGIDSKQELWKVNPELFRNLDFMITLNPDVLNPKSEDLERAFMLEEYDRAIANPLLDQEQVTRDFLLDAYSKSRKDPDKYFSKPNSTDPFNQMVQQAKNSQINAPNGQNQPQSNQKQPVMAGKTKAPNAGTGNIPSTGQLG